MWNVCQPRLNPNASFKLFSWTIHLWQTMNEFHFIQMYSSVWLKEHFCILSFLKIEHAYSNKNPHSHKWYVYWLEYSTSLKARFFVFIYLCSQIGRADLYMLLHDPTVLLWSIKKRKVVSLVSFYHIWCC